MRGSSRPGPRGRGITGLGWRRQVSDSLARRGPHEWGDGPAVNLATAGPVVRRSVARRLFCWARKEPPVRGSDASWQAVSMTVTPAGKTRGVSSTQLLLAAGAAFVVAIVGVWAYPFLASFGAPGVFLAAARAVTYACLVAVFAFPVAAIVRRLIR